MSNAPDNLQSPVPGRPRGIGWRRMVWVCLWLGLGGVLLTVLAALLTYPTLPDTSSLSNYRPQQPLRVLTADGVEIGGFGAEHRVYLPIAQIPQLMKDALVSVEDARFYHHHGVDTLGVARALAYDLIGRRLQGGSSITQQVARTFFLSRSRTLGRKFREVLLAWKIESQISKEQILELYMNQIYLGERAYGFAAAAQTYFGKPLSELDAAECAMLAGLPQNPSYANPIHDFERATARQHIVLASMLAQEVITPAQYKAALAEKLQVRKANEVDVHAEFVAEMVRQQIFAQYGELSYTTGLTVVTTLRAAEQQAAWPRTPPCPGHR